VLLTPGWSLFRAVEQADRLDGGAYCREGGMNRRTFLLGVAMCALALAFALLDHLFADPIRPANYRKINLGMNEREVECLLGMPSTDSGRGLAPGEISYTVKVDMDGRFRRKLLRGSRFIPFSPKYWAGRDWQIAVGFDEKGVAVAKELDRFERQGQSGLLDRLRTSLGW
jgi:hypothetical protein